MRFRLMASTGLLTASVAACAGAQRAEPAGPSTIGPAAAAAATVPPAPVDAVTSNPLISEWSGPYGGVPPFDQVRPELFPSAFQAGIDARRAEIRAITANPSRRRSRTRSCPCRTRDGSCRG
jgi:peptidyl-dipeptidase Dcp